MRNSLLLQPRISPDLGGFSIAAGAAFMLDLVVRMLAASPAPDMRGFPGLLAHRGRSFCHDLSASTLWKALLLYLP